MTRKAAFQATQDIDAILALSEDERVEALTEAGIYDDDCMEKSGIELLREQKENAIKEEDREISAMLRIYEREYPDIPMPEQMQECIWDGSMEVSDAAAEAFATRQANTKSIIDTMVSAEGQKRFKLLRKTIEAEYRVIGHTLRFIPNTVVREYISEVINDAGILPWMLKPQPIRITRKGMVEVRYGKRILYRFKLPAIYRKWAIGYKAALSAKPAGSIAAEIQELLDTAKK